MKNIAIFIVYSVLFYLLRIAQLITWVCLSGCKCVTLHWNQQFFIARNAADSCMKPLLLLIYAIGQTSLSRFKHLQ